MMKKLIRVNQMSVEAEKQTVSRVESNFSILYSIYKDLANKLGFTINTEDWEQWSKQIEQAALKDLPSGLELLEVYKLRGCKILVENYQNQLVECKKLDKLFPYYTAAIEFDKHKALVQDSEQYIQEVAKEYAEGPLEIAALNYFNKIRGLIIDQAIFADWSFQHLHHLKPLFSFDITNGSPEVTRESIQHFLRTILGSDDKEELLISNYYNERGVIHEDQEQEQEQEQ